MHGLPLGGVITGANIFAFVTLLLNLSLVSPRDLPRSLIVVSPRAPGNWLLYSHLHGCNRQTTPFEAMRAIFFSGSFFGMRGGRFPVLWPKKMYEIEDEIWFKTKRTLSCGLTSLLRWLWHVNVRPRYQRWNVDNATQRKESLHRQTIAFLLMWISSSSSLTYLPSLSTLTQPYLSVQIVHVR